MTDPAQPHEPLDVEALKRRYPKPWGGNEILHAHCPSGTLHRALAEIVRLREALAERMDNDDPRRALLPPDMRP